MVDIDVQNRKFCNILQVALYQGDKKITWLLIKNRADIYIQNKEFGNTLQKALIKGHKNIV